MGLYPETNKTARIIFAFVAMLAATAPLRPAFSGESAEAARPQKTKATETITSPTASQQSAPALRTRQENNNSDTGTWNRTPSSSQSPTSANQTKATEEVDVSVMQPDSPKSNTGLTRTLEEGLKSNDAYLRERARRFLRLQMQLLQLRSRQAAAADNAAVETTAKSTTNGNSENSILLKRVNLVAQLTR